MKAKTEKKEVRATRNWYQDYLKHPNAQYKMSFLQYKELRKQGKMK